MDKNQVITKELTYPSNMVRCPKCGKQGYVFYLKDRTEYEAQCTSCGYLFDKRKRMSSTDLGIL